MSRAYKNLKHVKTLIFHAGNKTVHDQMLAFVRGWKDNMTDVIHGLEAAGPEAQSGQSRDTSGGAVHDGVSTVTRCLANSLSSRRSGRPLLIQDLAKT